MPIVRTEGGVRLAVRVTPRAPANRLQGVVDMSGRGRRLKAQVTAAPEAGKANAALIRLLAKTFKCPKTALEIISGTSDRNKVVAISGDPDILERTIKSALRL